MKSFLSLILAFTVFTNLGYANKKRRKKRKAPFHAYYMQAKNSFRGNKPFIASSFLKIYMVKANKPTKASIRLMAKILEKTNIYPFLDLPISKLKRIAKHSNINYLAGKKAFFKKKDNEAIQFFKKVSKSSPFYPQSRMHLASLSEINGLYSLSRKYTKECIQSTSRTYNNMPTDNREIQGRIRDHIYDICRQLLPRMLYKQGEITKSIRFFEKLDNQSYLFPNALFDSSWAYWRDKDYNRAVGRNLTFQAPLFDDYFLPETELVKALSYLEVCDYDEALAVVKNFEKKIRAKAERFIKSFRLKESGNNYAYLDLIYSSKLRKQYKDNFIIKLVTVLQVKPGMMLLKHYLGNLRKEKARAKTSIERKAYKAAFKKFTKFFNSYVKLKFVKYSKEVIRISNIFAEIELDLYTLLKHRIYDEKAGKKSIQERLEFYLKNTNRKKSQYYWDFKGEFWADELGNYIPLLENKCKNKRGKKK